MATAISSLFSGKLASAQIVKVREVCSRLGINPNWLLAVMYFETAKTFSPSKRNNIGSVGLIQFTRDKAGVNYKTINGKKYLLDDLAKMSFIQQMDVVLEYYKPFAGKMNSFIDVYLVTFFPAARGKADSYVLQTSGLSASLIAKQNPIFDRNKDGKITKGEIVKYFSSLWGSVFDREINVIKSVGATSAIIGLLVFFYTCLAVNL